MRIIFAGGGTLGSVSPLLAIYTALRQSGWSVTPRWVGTKSGPERSVVVSQGIPFQSIFSAKLRRYFDWRTFVVPWAIGLGVMQAWRLLGRFRPQVVVCAGSYVSLPVAFAAWIRRIPIMVHQLDVHPTLTNRILTPLASRITVSFAQSLGHFPRRKTTLTGNPVRGSLSLPTRAAACAYLHLDPSLPVVLVIGGGTGAAALNRLVWAALPSLLACGQVVHLTGRGKMEPIAEHPRYRAYEFLDADLPQAFAAADLVVSRAGGGTLSELAVLGKPTIVMPIPGSYQEANALAFAKQNAAILVPQAGISASDFAQRVCQVLGDLPLLASLNRNMSKMMPANAAQTVAGIVRHLIEA